jgi:RNA polymerase sigma-70 factor, ECF subfamily
MPFRTTHDSSPALARDVHALDPERLSDHVDALYRAAWALSGSRHDAEDLVQETFASILKRPRWIRRGSELGYLLRSLRNTYFNRLRTSAERATIVQLRENDEPSLPDSRASAREIMEAIASAPEPYREAVIAVDVLGLSYREAARSLRTREATITSRLHRGRAHIASILLVETTVAAGGA